MWLLPRDQAILTHLLSGMGRVNDFSALCSVVVKRWVCSKLWVDVVTLNGSSLAWVGWCYSPFFR